MRHQNTGRQLSRNSAHRAALMRNMAGALLREETIRTTLPKAKELRRVVEPLITLAREDAVANRRLAFARLRDNEVVAKLFTDLGPHFKTRPGGYTRILKFGFRAGDKAPMAVMQLVDREAQISAVSEKHAAARKVRRDAEAGRTAGARSEDKASEGKSDKTEKAEAKKKAKVEKAAKNVEKMAAKTARKAESKAAKAKPKAEKTPKPRAAKKTEKNQDK